MKAALRIFYRNPLPVQELANAAFSVANCLGTNETKWNQFEPSVSRESDEQTRMMSVTNPSRENIEREILAAGGISGTFLKKEIKGEFTVGNPPLTDQHSYCPICDVRIDGQDDALVIKLLENVATDVLGTLSWDYGFITDLSIDNGALPYPFGYKLGLPRVFWTNYLGQIFVDLMGDSQVDRCGATVTKVPGGRKLTLRCSPSSVHTGSSTAQKQIDELVMGCGADFFINRKYWKKTPVLSRVVPKLFHFSIGAVKRPTWPAQQRPSK